MRICFDMDGTIADLYGVDGWLENLIAEDVRPYREAKVLLNMQALAKVLNNLQKKGYEIGIISWLSKNGSKNYNEKVRLTKIEWLKKHLKSVKFDFLEIVNYGTDKNLVCTGNSDILFDDEIRNRESWKGISYNVENIIEVLRGLK